MHGTVNVTMTDIFPANKTHIQVLKNVDVVTVSVEKGLYCSCTLVYHNMRNEQDRPAICKIHRSNRKKEEILYDHWPSHGTITTDAHYWGQVCPNFVSVKTGQLVHFPCLHRQAERYFTC